VGKTCGRGFNGQGSRSGSGGMLYFEGGQMPLQRRVPKRGFSNPVRARVANVDVGALEQCPEGEVTIELLRELGLLKGRFDRVKVLGTGQLTKKLTVHAHGFSKSAAAKIEAAGGSAVVVELRQSGPKVTPSTQEASAD
jgi:large subunit ribosomal protein L15